MINKSIVKYQIGRKSVVNDNVLAKLESVFKLGVNDEVACSYAGIHPATFYRHMNSNKSFASKIKTAKGFLRIAASQVVANAIIENKDLQSAKWWLEKKHPDEFGGKPETVQQTQINVREVIQNWVDGTE
jgi:hypothetical protein